MSDARPSPLVRLARAWRSLAKQRRQNPFVPRLSAMLLRPLPFHLLYRVRWWWHRARGVPLRMLPADGASAHVTDVVLGYNLAKVRGYDRLRTERLINVLRCVHGLDAARAATLVIGPRNEAELLLLRLYGFRDVTAIDLFSYTPWIRVMDMHRLDFAADSFDVVYSAYTLRYSDDLPRACGEIVRCARDGALVAAIFATDDPADRRELVDQRSQTRERIIGTELGGGVRDLLAAFGPHVGPVLWSEEYAAVSGGLPGRHCSVVFRVRKPALSSPPAPS